jgi:hypothetical protein
VTRYFAKIVKVTGYGGGYGLNILKFNLREMTIEQITLNGPGGQEGKFTDFKYEEARERLTFVVEGKIVEFPIYEFSEETFNTMRRADNWKNLAHGLKIKSEKTLEWLKKRGIYG